MNGIYGPSGLAGFATSMAFLTQNNETCPWFLFVAVLPYQIFMRWTPDFAMEVLFAYSQISYPI